RGGQDAAHHNSNRRGAAPLDTRSPRPIRGSSPEAMATSKQKKGQKAATHAGSAPPEPPLPPAFKTPSVDDEPEPPKRRATAESMATRQRDISVSEFFTKNRHLLGFDNPAKAPLTTVKEAVDNSLDACEEAGILPELYVEIRETSAAQLAQ